MNKFTLKAFRLGDFSFKAIIVHVRSCASCFNSTEHGKANRKDNHLGLRDLCSKKLDIRKNTQFVKSELVPEFSLHLITPNMEVWHQPSNELHLLLDKEYK